MKIFCALTIFISLSITVLGCYLIAKAVLAWSQSYFAVAQVVFGGALALVGAAVTLAIFAVAVARTIHKHRMKNKGGKQ